MNEESLFFICRNYDFLSDQTMNKPLDTLHFKSENPKETFLFLKTFKTREVEWLLRVRC